MRWPFVSPELVEEVVRAVGMAGATSLGGGCRWHGAAFVVDLPAVTSPAFHWVPLDELLWRVGFYVAISVNIGS